MKIKNKLGMLLAGLTVTMFTSTQASACGLVWFVPHTYTYVQPKPVVVQNVVVNNVVVNNVVVNNVTVVKEKKNKKHNKCKKHKKCGHKKHKKQKKQKPCKKCNQGY